MATAASCWNRNKQSLHKDLTPRDRFCWLTSSGWIMWNSQWMALGQGATVAMFDGAPNHPDMGVIWRFIADEKLTYLRRRGRVFQRLHEGRRHAARGGGPLRPALAQRDRIAAVGGHL